MKRTKHSRGLAAALALAIACLGTSSVASAAAKAGSSCSKAGLTTVVKSQTKQTKFTCIRSGKKLVWNKGVVSKVAAKPIATREPTPAAEVKPISLANLDPKQVRVLAYKEVTRELAENSAFLPSITYLVGPSLSPERVGQEKTALGRAASFWSDIYRPNDIYIGYFAEKDVDWVDKAFCEGAGYCPSNGGNSLVISEQIKADAVKFCNFAAARQTPKGPFFNQCLGVGSDSVGSRQTGPHEYTHFAQIGASRMDVPNWWKEGSASYFGASLGLYEKGEVPQAMDSVLFTASYNYIGQTFIAIDPKSPESVKAGFKFTYQQLGPPTPGSRWIFAHVSYYPGALATEAMVALWGMDKVKTFMTALKTGDFDATFANTFGVNIEDFYDAASKYVVAMYAKAP